MLGPFKVYEGGTPSRRLNPCEPCAGIWACLGHGAARAEVASHTPEGTLGSDAPNVEADAGSEQFLGTSLSDPDFESGFQASLPRGLWISWGQK